MFCFNKASSLIHKSVKIFTDATKCVSLNKRFSLKKNHNTHAFKFFTPNVYPPFILIPTTRIQIRQSIQTVITITLFLNFLYTIYIPQQLHVTHSSFNLNIQTFFFVITKKPFLPLVYIYKLAYPLDFLF